MPHDLACVARRRSSIIRSGVRATSMPPLSVNTPRALYCSVESLVSSNIILEYSIGKMKFDACPVDPPGLGIGPLSTRTRSRQPSRARWWTRLLPTIPAPITTALARTGISFMTSSRWDALGLWEGPTRSVGALGRPRTTRRTSTAPPAYLLGVRVSLPSSDRLGVGQVRRAPPWEPAGLARPSGIGVEPNPGPFSSAHVTPSLA